MTVDQAVEFAPAKLVPDESGDDLWKLNFGPQHPATHTTLRLVLELDGETVVGCTPHIGYLHSGFEKLGEHLDYNQYVVVTDRMNYISPMANNIAWHHACEKLFGIEITPRCKVLRGTEVVVSAGAAAHVAWVDAELVQGLGTVGVGVEESVADEVKVAY